MRSHNLGFSWCRLRHEASMGIENPSFRLCCTNATLCRNPSSLLWIKRLENRSFNLHRAHVSDGVKDWVILGTWHDVIIILDGEFHPATDRWLCTSFLLATASAQEITGREGQVWVTQVDALAGKLHRFDRNTLEPDVSTSTQSNIYLSVKWSQLQSTLHKQAHRPLSLTRRPLTINITQFNLKIDL